MKVIITESQHKFLLEQSMMGWAKDLPPRAADEALKGWSKGNHDVNTILQIGTAFIPLVGPFLSAGIGLMDAAQYYQEGDKKTAGLVAMFSMLPGVGTIVNKIPGVKQLGDKGLSLLASKLGKGITKFTPLEKQVIAGINANEQLVKTELNNQIKQLAQKSLTSKVVGTSKNILTKVGKGGLKFTGAVAPYVGANVVYNKIYDRFNPEKQFVDLSKIDVNKISDANKQAAKELQF
jgi:hypothetical protein